MKTARIRIRGAEIVAAVMKSPRTVRELAEILGVEVRRRSSCDKIRDWAEEYRRSGVFYVKGYRRHCTGGSPARVYALQPELFAAQDADRRVIA